MDLYFDSFVGDAFAVVSVAIFGVSPHDEMRIPL